MKIYADTHVHTLASTHAFSTLIENAKCASEIGLEYLAITDHGPALPDSPHIWHFVNMRMVPNELFGVTILKGVEANILDETGEIDLSSEILDTLDWVIASIHGPALRHNLTYEQCTQAYINVAKNKYVNVIGHSGSAEFQYDYEKVIPIFKQNNKLVEINENSFLVRKSSFENCLKIAELCKKHEVNIVVNSDAHFANSVGVCVNAIKMLKNIDFPEYLIVNSSTEKFQQYINDKKHVK